jgi:hypothetical protein
MARTTLNIDAPILKELKEIQRKEKRSLGKIVSQLLMEALAVRKKPTKVQKFKWVSRPMHCRIDLSDKDVLYSRLDRDEL